MSVNSILSDWESDYRRDKATRQLSTGVYLDRKFRDSVIRQILLDPAHRVAPSYGFDLVPVVEHAKRAFALELGVSLCFVAMMVGAWLVLPAMAITVCCVLGFWAAVRHLARTLPKVGRLRAKEAIDHFRHRVRGTREKYDLDELKREARLAAIACAALFFVPFVAAAVQGTPVGTVFRAASWASIAFAVVAFAGAGSTRYAANRMFKSESLAFRRMSRRQQRIDEQQQSAYAIYSRPVTKSEDDDEDLPRWSIDLGDERDIFIGAGELVHKWLPPLTVPLMVKQAEESNESGKPNSSAPREHKVTPFEPDDLIDSLQAAIQEVGDRFEPTSLPNLVIGDRIYVEEMVLSNDRDRLRRPLNPDERRKIINAPYGPFHHFLEICTTATGEVVVTVFLRATVKARTLCFDFAACALTRLPRKYEILDHFGEHGTPSVLRAGAAAVWDLPKGVLDMWRLAKLPRLLLGWLWARFDWTTLRRRGSAVGTVFSVRKECAAPWKDAEHDRAEILGLMKIIEQRLLRAAEEFLDGHGVDTSDFKKKAQTIISANVLNMGRMNIQNSAVGENAQVNQNGTGGHEDGD